MPSDPPPKRTTEVGAMQRAVALAARGWLTASPNPVVGCVLLAPNGAVVGEGWHERPGGPHAEVVALRAAGPAARGATAVVTLEPCNHTGRTGPCAQALVEAGVRRVVFAVPDPSPAAAGGARTLAAAGVDVRAGLLRAEAEEVNAAWLHSTRHGRPQVTWKLAATLDGRSAAADGSSRWITSAAARADVHRLRLRSDAVVVGVGTVLADDPELTVRLPPGDDAGDGPTDGLTGGPTGGPDGVPAGRPDSGGTGEPGSGRGRQPLRVVLDRDGRTPPRARVRDGSAPSLVLTAADVGAGPGGVGVDLPAALGNLHARHVRSVLLEGGPTLAGAFLDAGLVDRVVAYLAPALLGQGAAALASTTTGRTIADIARLRLVEVTAVGPDLRLIAVPDDDRPVTG